MGHNTKTYRTIWFVLVVLLCLPIIQGITKVINIKPLQGDINAANATAFSWDGWFSESFQEKITPFLKEEVGFYPDFIRINNQLTYWLTNEANANGVVIGKSGYLYEKNYINAYLGNDFIGQEKINNRVNAIASLRQKLIQKGKELLVLLAPGKASYFPEFIPTENVPLIYPQKTNYVVFKNTLQQHQVPTIDANQWFRSMKDTSQYPLFPKCGIHWSKYGEYLMADSLSNYLNTLFPGSFPSIELETITWSDKNLNTDYDLGDGMNMIFQLPVFPMAYPTFKYSAVEQEKKKVIIVADSYYWGLHNAAFTNKSFNNGEFWYYNKQVYYGNGKQPEFLDEVDVIENMNQADIIILMSTDANLYKFPFDLTERLSISKQNFEKRVLYHENRIYADAAWLEMVKQKAILKSISLEEAVTMDAEYLTRQELIYVNQ